MYEYHIWISTHIHVEEHLNELGLERWKLIHVCKTDPNWTFIFVRALVPSVLTESTHEIEQVRLS